MVPRRLRVVRVDVRHAAAILATGALLVTYPRGAAAQSSDAPAQAGSNTQAPSDPSRTGDPRDNLIPADGPTANPAQPAVDPKADQQRLVEQGRTRPTNDGSIGARPSEVYSEDWWAHTRPILELHGYFRTRGELYHNFSLGRPVGPGGDDQNLWPQPIDNSYTQANGTPRQVLLCGDSGTAQCSDKSESHANLRLRLNPEIHISDNLRIMAQVDMLDNLVLGSTPDAYALRPQTGTAPGNGTGYTGAINGYNGYAPLGAFSITQGPPTAGVNSYQNSISVQRAWGEYMTPVGQLRFGRMPSHWGLGMVVNSGDRIDDDYQTNADRLMFISGIKSMDLYFGGAWDFPNSGPTSSTPYDVYGGQPRNVSNLANTEQWTLFFARRTNPELQRLKLSRGDAVFNGGIYSVYRRQYLDVKASTNPITADRGSTNNGLERRGAEAFIPDVWMQLLWGKLRFEAEFAAIAGSVDNSPVKATISDPLKIRQWGFTSQTELRAVEDKLRVQFGAGYASGDPNVEGLAPGANGLQPRLSGGALSTFRFHPAYYVDYIFFRRIMTRVQNAYYLRPSVEYDFVRNPNGQKFGGGAAIIWSRAAEFIQTPGNKRDLGVELDLQVYYQSKDGSLNDDPNKMGGFYAALQYGVFFPLGGLEYLPGERTEAAKVNANLDISTAQTVRLITGIMF